MDFCTGKSKVFIVCLIQNGILRIAQESIFSGLNNLTVNSILDETYDKYFGFTRAEVQLKNRTTDAGCL